MKKEKLVKKNDHLFIEIEKELWLIDTGSPASFGTHSINIGGKDFNIPQSFMGMLDTDYIREQTKVDCAGLIGSDILNRFDFIFDLQNEEITLSTDELSMEGNYISLGNVMGCCPIAIQVEVEQNRHTFLLDTGAAISYFAGIRIDHFDSLGRFHDFHPGNGDFETDMYLVPVSIGDVKLNLRGGTLPSAMEMQIGMLGAHGIIGNELMDNRKVGYFPRRKMLVL